MPAPADLNSFFDIYRSAVLAKDVDAMMSIYGPDFTAFDMWGAWSLVGEAPWLEMNKDWLGSLGSESVIVEFDDITIIPGTDVAAAHATLTFKAVSDKGETLRSMQNRLTWVAKRTDGIWKIIHQHTSVPIEPAGMKPRLHR